MAHMPSKENYVYYSHCSELCFSLALHPKGTDVFVDLPLLTAKGEGT